MMYMYFERKMNTGDAASTNFSENNAIQQHKQLNQLRKKCILQFNDTMIDLGVMPIDSKFSQQK